METMTKEKLIEMLEKYENIGYIIGDKGKLLKYKNRYIIEDNFSKVAPEILALHNAEIAKYKELIETCKELIADIDKHIGTSIIEVQLRQKIAELESEVEK